MFVAVDVAVVVRCFHFSACTSLSHSFTIVWCVCVCVDYFDALDSARKKCIVLLIRLSNAFVMLSTELYYDSTVLHLIDWISCAVHRMHSYGEASRINLHRSFVGPNNGQSAVIFYSFFIAHQSANQSVSCKLLYKHLETAKQYVWPSTSTSTWSATTTLDLII